MIVVQWKPDALNNDPLTFLKTRSCDGPILYNYEEYSNIKPVLIGTCFMFFAFYHCIPLVQVFPIAPIYQVFLISFPVF